MTNGRFPVLSRFVEYQVARWRAPNNGNRKAGSPKIGIAFRIGRIGVCSRGESLDEHPNESPPSDLSVPVFARRWR